MTNSFNARKTLTLGDQTYDYFSISQAQGLGDVSRLPITLKILLENLLRFEDGNTVTADDVRALSEWTRTAASGAVLLALALAALLL